MPFRDLVCLFLTVIVSLTVGPALGSIRQLFAKIKAIDAKHGKFDFALCVGDFFGGAVDGADETQALLDGMIEGEPLRVKTERVF